jgi:hypothetical protein
LPFFRKVAEIAGLARGTRERVKKHRRFALLLPKGD